MAKRGRPKLPADQLHIMPILSVRLGKDEFKEIERLARQSGQSRSNFMRGIVRAGLATQKESGEVSNG